MKVGVLENLGINVTGKTLGIIGMGRIGKALAKRANACGMEVSIITVATVCRRRDKAERDIRFQGGAPLPIRFPSP